jgi:hypothetical protein
MPHLSAGTGSAAGPSADGGVMDRRPVIQCFVAYPLGDFEFTEPALVSLEVAEELFTRGYTVLTDPQDEIDLATWERMHRWITSRRVT